MIPFLFLILDPRFLRIGIAVGGVLSLLGAGFWAYQKGYSAASARCHEAALRAELATMRRDMAAWKAADAIDQQLQADLEAERNDLQQKVHNYEAELSRRPDNRCTLSADDLRSLDRLRRVQKR